MLFSRRQFFQALVSLPPVKAAMGEMETSRTLHPTLIKVTLPIKGLDRRLDGMRIGQISDVHVGIALPPQHLLDAVRLFDANPPDLLAVTGDLLDDAAVAPACFQLLQRVKAPYGTFFILGNHDIGAGRKAVLDVACNTQGITTLLNQELDVTVQGARFHVSGVDCANVRGDWDLTAPQYAEYIHQSTQRSDDGDFRLCLVHHPDNFDEIARKRVELTLAGHTHGGQVAPLSGLMSARFKYMLGHYQHTQHPDSHLYVSGGTGHWFPLRVGVPAEVTELTLRRV
jgi:predicted MPP superfamily phosphohydrolase